MCAHLLPGTQISARYREELSRVLKKGQRSRRYLTDLSSLSAWRSVYNLVLGGADVNAPDPEGHTPLFYVLTSSGEPYRVSREGPWGGMRPKSLLQYRLDSHRRDMILKDPKCVFPCLPSYRVSDKDCIVELMLRAGANPNVLTQDQHDDYGDWIWANIFTDNNYPHPRVLALILANADVCCNVPKYCRGQCRDIYDIRLFEHILLICQARLNNFKVRHRSMFCCYKTNCFFQMLRSLARCLYLLVAAGAYVSADHKDTLMRLRDTAADLLYEDAQSNPGPHDLLVTINILEKLCQAASSPRSLADLCRLRLRAALGTIVNTNRKPHRGGWRLGLANLCRRGYSPYISTRTPTETFQQRLSRLKLSPFYTDVIVFAELKAICDRFNDQPFDGWLFPCVSSFILLKSYSSLTLKLYFPL